jgi:hypothetical protein
VSNSLLTGRKKRVEGDLKESNNIEVGKKGESGAANAKPPQDGAKPAKKVRKGILQVRDNAAFSLYIFRVLKMIKPNLAISKKAVA